MLRSYPFYPRVCSPSGGAALSKRRGEDLARAKVAAKQNQRRLEAAE